MRRKRVRWTKGRGWEEGEGGGVGEIDQSSRLL